MTKKEFQQELKSSANIALQRGNKFLSQLDLTIHINWEYDDWDYNGLDNAIGVYERDSVFEGDISIGFNINNLYKWFVKEIRKYPWSDPYTILDEAIQTNVFHEMGHGIIELLDDYLYNTDELDDIYHQNQELFENVLDNEEDSVEEFAWEMYDNHPQDSEIGTLLDICAGALGNNPVDTEEENLNGIVGEEIKKFMERLIQESIGQNCLSTWYRGYNSAYGSRRNHLLWVTDTIEYAEEYGDTVDEVVIDDTRLRLASLQEMDETLGYEYDYYEGPDEEEALRLIENGYDGYAFETSDAYCMCLWNDEPIVETRTIESK